MSRAGASQQSGFSLMEVLIAVAVFAVVSTAALALLVQGLRAREAHSQVMADVTALQRLHVLLREDFGQLVMRAPREADGRRARIAFAGDGDGLDLGPGARSSQARLILAFTRTGWVNPGAQAPRSTLQRVAYLYDGNRLIRQAWPYPDLVEETAPERLTLLEGVEDLTVEFRAGPTWVDRYEAGLGEGGAGPPPRALRLTYTHPSFGPMEHVVLTPAGMR